MFQSFEVTSRPEQGPPRLADLRVELAREGLDGFLIPRADAHQGEYVSARDERLSWLTGFTGSAGFCAALIDIAGIFIDGRYRTQVKTEVASDFTPVAWPEVSLAEWLTEHLPKGGKIGFDPWLHTVAQIEQARDALAGSDIELIGCDNLIDRIWADQPQPAMLPASAHPLEFAGEAHTDKCNRLAAALAKADQSAAVITLPDSVCWLLNIRGADIPRNPIAQGCAVLNADASVDLFMQPSKLEGLEEHLGDHVRIHQPSEFLAFVSSLTGAVRLDKTSAPVIVADAIGDAVVWGDDPCALPKACKNAAEIAGSAEAPLKIER